MTHSATDPIAARLLDAAIHSLRTDILPLLSDDVARMRIDHITRMLRAASTRLTQREISLSKFVADAASSGFDAPPIDGEPGLATLEQQRHVIEDAMTQGLPTLLERIAAGDAEALSKLEAMVALEKDFFVSQDADILHGSQIVYRGGRIDPETEVPATNPWPPIDAAALTAYLRKHGGRDTLAAEDVRLIPGGFSKETVFFTLVDTADGSRQQRVIRKDMPLPFVEKHVADEFGLLRALHAHGFPVAPPLWLESDPSCLGAPFLVSARVAGTSNAASWTSDPERAAKACRELARVLARLHGYSPIELGYPAVLAGRSAGELMEADIARWTQVFHARRREALPLQQLPLEWLARNIPAALYQRPAHVVHGDFGFHNLMFDEQGEVTALLDWEFSVLGDPTQDLCFVRLFVEPLINWQAFLDLYLSFGGTAPCEEASFFYDLWIKARNAIGCVAGQKLFDTAMPREVKFALVGHVFAPYLYIDECESLIAHLKQKTP